MPEEGYKDDRTGEVSDLELTKIRVEYWTKRLDQTLSHLQTASKLIYLVDGAVLAFAYFIVNIFGLTRSVAGFLSTVAFVLSCINFLHSRFILNQAHWYRMNDKHIRNLLDQKEIVSRRDGCFNSSNDVLKLIHIVISVWSLLITAILLGYACEFDRGLQYMFK